MQKHETSATLSQDTVFDPKEQVKLGALGMMISCSVKSLLEDVKVSVMVMSLSASFGLEIWNLFVSCMHHLAIIVS